MIKKLLSRERARSSSYTAPHLGHNTTSVFALWHLTKKLTKLSAVLGYIFSSRFPPLQGCSNLSLKVLSKLAWTLRFSIIEHLGHISIFPPFFSWQFQR